MTQLDKLKQAAENSLKEKFSCVVYPYLGSGMLTNTEDADVIERNTNYCLTASLELPPQKQHESIGVVMLLSFLSGLTMKDSLETLFPEISSMMIF